MLVVATSSLVLVSFLVPLALVLRTFAADRAVSTATVEAQLAPLVATLGASSLQLAVAQVNADEQGAARHGLPAGRDGGGPARGPVRRRPAGRRGRSFSTARPGGVEVLVAVQGLPAGTAVIRIFVPDAVLRHGVTGHGCCCAASASGCWCSA